MTGLIVGAVALAGLGAFAVERWAAHRLHRIRRARYGRCHVDRGYPR